MLLVFQRALRWNAEVAGTDGGRGGEVVGTEVFAYLPLGPG